MPCAPHSHMVGCPCGGQAEPGRLRCQPACAQPYTALLHKGTCISCPFVVLFKQFGPQHAGASCWSAQLHIVSDDSSPGVASSDACGCIPVNPYICCPYNSLKNMDALTAIAFLGTVAQQHIILQPLNFAKCDPGTLEHIQLIKLERSEAGTPWMLSDCTAQAAAAVSQINTWHSCESSCPSPLSRLPST